MDKLVAGVLHFQREIYPKYRRLYRSLASKQAPRWFLLACSDSRVVPNLIAQAAPGDLFICRNAGNIVPAHGNPPGGVSATIEYAVEALKVKHILVCGHSDCGAMKAVLHPENVAALPAVSEWIAYAQRARAIVLQRRGKKSERQLLAELTEENVLAQLDNLRTLPPVAAKLKAGKLQLHGWVYDIARGEFRWWDPAEDRWRKLDEFGATAKPSREAAKRRAGERRRGVAA